MLGYRWLFLAKKLVAESFTNFTVTNDHEVLLMLIAIIVSIKGV
ncbi:hypothetical protein V3595_01300 [Bacillus sp. CFBP9009]